MLSFYGRHFPKAVILMAVRWYVAYALSYRDIEELMNERGVNVDHATIQRWVVKYSPELMKKARKVMKSSAESWRMDETYIKVKGEWVYLYRAVDKFGNTIDFMLSQKRDKPAATRFFTQAIGHAGLPDRVVIDKSGANTAGINAINEQLSTAGLFAFAITMIQSKYLNNIVEQDHRFIKKITRPMLGFFTSGFTRHIRAQPGQGQQHHKRGRVGRNLQIEFDGAVYCHGHYSHGGAEGHSLHPRIAAAKLGANSGDQA
jgi:putative transposase